MRSWVPGSLLALSLLACGNSTPTATDDSAVTPPDDLTVTSASDGPPGPPDFVGADLSGPSPLRISEVGAAFYDSSNISSAWIELTNVSGAPVQLHDFPLHSSTLAPGATTHTIPPPSRARGGCPPPPTSTPAPWPPAPPPTPSARRPPIYRRR